MQGTLEAQQTQWSTGAFRSGASRLLFGYTYEDAAIETAAFAGRRRVFCIAGAGCTARALATAGHDVTAVDINPVQLEYARARAAGGSPSEGAAERLMSVGRKAAALAGWNDVLLHRFLLMDDAAEQARFWDERLATGRLRAAMDLLLSRVALRIAYSGALLESLPAPFGPCLRARLRRCWAQHPNRSNPYAWLLLAGRPHTAQPESPVTVRFESADAATFLESCATESFEAFSLSNICDGATPAYVARLNEAVRRAATRDAVVVSRSFAEVSLAADNYAARDRSGLWGAVTVRTAEEDPCCIC